MKHQTEKWTGNSILKTCTNENGIEHFKNVTWNIGYAMQKMIVLKASQYYQVQVHIK